MGKYLMRLDDASVYRDIQKWERIENLLDKYHVKPLVGIIPDNQDPSIIQVYPKDEEFWSKVSAWQSKGWSLALHGCYHRYVTKEGGINPVNKRSEFAGVAYDEQCEKIKHGMQILKEHNVCPDIFFAPSHTFDRYTLLALKKESNIRVICDTIANDVYYQDGFYFIPQQSGRVRNLPFAITTFCYHPNMMNEHAFYQLEKFINKNFLKFTNVTHIVMRKRELSLFDQFLRKMYFLRKR